MLSFLQNQIRSRYPAADNGRNGALGSTTALAQAFMDILIAEDDNNARAMLGLTLQRWGHRVFATADGQSAYEALIADNSPPLVILDSSLPKLDGLTLCRRLRENPSKQFLYIILLTANGEQTGIADDLDCGADDFITKPLNYEELRARINVGGRFVTSQQRLSERILELEEQLKRFKQLQGLLSICSYCKRIRNDENYWQRVEEFIIEHSDAHFSHGICPKCFEAVIKAQLREQGMPTEELHLERGVVP